MPIVILLYLLNPDLIGTFATIIVPLECIMMGLTTIYSELNDRKNERKNYKVCDGIIKNTEFKLLNFNWIKAPVVSYVLDGKSYETHSNIGINGIISFFIKEKKVKVYYKEDNPEITSLNNNTPIIVGIFLLSLVSIYLLYKNINKLNAL